MKLEVLISSLKNKPEELIRKDIESGISHVCMDHGEVAACFVCFVGEEPDYREMVIRAAAEGEAEAGREARDFWAAQLRLAFRQSA